MAAEVFAKKGAEVVLVSGPSNCKAEHSNIDLVKVETAQQMYEACHNVFKQTDIAILSAAVADYTIENPSEIKIKKKNRKSKTRQKASGVLHQMLRLFILVL